MGGHRLSCAAEERRWTRSHALGNALNESWLQPDREGHTLEIQPPQGVQCQTSPLNRWWTLGSKGFRLNN